MEPPHHHHLNARAKILALAVWTSVRHLLTSASALSLLATPPQLLLSASCSMPLLPFQTFIDHFYDLIPSLCAAMGVHFDFLSACYLSSPLMSWWTHPRRTPAPLCRFLHTQWDYSHAHTPECVTNPENNYLHLRWPWKKKTWLSSQARSATETTLFAHKYFKSSVLKV